MRSIKIHNPCNEFTKHNRNYNKFWDDLTEALKKKYNVSENRYCENAHKHGCIIELKNGISKNYNLMECEYVIEFMDSGEFYLISVSDRLSAGILNECSNHFFKKALISQFNYDYLKHHVREHIEKYSPWLYFTQNIFDYNSFFEKRKKIENFIDKMYFRGNTSERPILKHFDKKYLEGVESIPNYFDDVINYKVGLSIAGVGELCYRDIEYMCMGIPFIRFEYLSKMNPELIPNYHYISVDRPNDIPAHNGLSTDRLGEYPHAKMIEKRFLEVKDNDVFLKKISDNAKDYYETYLNNNIINHTLNLLGI